MKTRPTSPTSCAYMHTYIHTYIHVHTHSTRFRASCIIRYACSARTHEISYDISLGILRDFLRDIVWNFARFCTIYRLRFCEISYEFSRVEYNVLKYYWKQTRSNNRCLVLNQWNIIHSNLIENDKLDNKSCFIFGIKYILEHICHKCKCESTCIQSASRRLKVCLILFISYLTIRTAITCTCLRL